MPAAFRIFPQEHLIIVHYHGFVKAREYSGVIDSGSAHADFHGELKYLIDLSDMVDFERDYPAFLAIQARVVDLVDMIETEGMSVFLAPHKVAMEGAQLVLRSWKDLHVPLRHSIVSDLGEAADLLGFSPGKLAEMRRKTIAEAR